MGFQDEVAALLETGVEPLTMTREIVRVIPDGTPRAFRTTLQINSPELGTITDEDYVVTAERTKRATLLFDRALMYAHRAIQQCRTAGLDFEWLSVRCPPSTVTREGLLTTIRRIFAGSEDLLPRLCIEFPTQFLYDPSDKIDEVFAEIKAMGIKTMLYGFGEDFCPTMRLLAYSFDYVALHANVVEMIRSPRTQASGLALLSYVKGFSAELILPGLDPSDLPAYESVECYGYTDRFPGRLFDEEGIWQKITV